MTVTKTWNGGNGGNWNTAANWSPSGVPGINDWVEILSGDDPFSTAVWTHQIGVLQVDTGGFLDLQSATGGTCNVGDFWDNYGTIRIDTQSGKGGSILALDEPDAVGNNYGTISIGNTTSTADSVLKVGAEANEIINSGTITLLGGTSGNASLDAAHGTLVVNNGSIFLFNGDVSSSSGLMDGTGSVYLDEGSRLNVSERYFATGATAGVVYFDGTSADRLHFDNQGAPLGNQTWVSLGDFNTSGDRFDTGLTASDTTWAFTAGTGGGTMVYTENSHTITQWIGGVTSSASLSVGADTNGNLKVVHV